MEDLYEKTSIIEVFSRICDKKKEDETITLLISKWHMLLDEDAVIARTVPSSLLLHPTLTPKSSD